MFEESAVTTKLFLARHADGELWLALRGGNCFVSTLQVAGQKCRPLVVYDGQHIGELAGLDGTRSERRGIA